MPPRRPAPTLPLFLAIAANILTIFSSLFAFITGYGNHRLFMQLVSYLFLSLPLPIALLAVCRRGSYAGIRDVNIFAIVLGCLQLLAILAETAATIFMFAGNNYPQVLIFLCYLPGFDCLADFVSGLFWIWHRGIYNLILLPGMFLNFIVSVLYPISTLSVILACRKAAVSIPEQDWLNQLDALYRQGAISDAEYQARRDSFYHHP